MRECKNICTRFESISFNFGGKIYQNSVKYCKTCSRFMNNDGYRCVCCKSNLRCKSHRRQWKTNVYKIKLVQNQEVFTN